MILYLIWNDHVTYDIMIFFTIWYYDMIFWYYRWCYNIIYDATLNWEYMALNIELRHLCQRQSTGDGWRNSIFKQAVRAMYVPKNDLFFAIFCAGLHPQFFLNIKLPLEDIDGASPTHSPKSGWDCPHRWRKSLIPPCSPACHWSHVDWTFLEISQDHVYIYIYVCVCGCPCACWRRASTGPKCLATHISEPWKG